MNNPKRKEIFILILCLLIGFTLRIYTYDQKSLWLDEIHTFNDSRDDIQNQLKYYKENPTYLHPPLFFILTHLFHPFTKPERDLRIIPLIFGTLSIPMIYLLARLFSPAIGLPCAISLTFMAYHISLSQDGRAYSLTMFLGILSLYFFIKYLKTSKKRYLVMIPFPFATLFYTSYSTILFIILSQILWFYQVNGQNKKPRFYYFLILNSILLLLCIPWILFLALNYHGQSMIHPYELKVITPLWSILSNVLNDWAPYAPLTVVSVVLSISLLLVSKPWTNALILFGLFILPIGGLFLFCRLFNIFHFITSRYLISFLPLFLITLYMSLSAIENRFEKLKKIMRLRLLFVILFIASNLVILPPYYHAEKEDFRGLVSYLKNQLREGDKLFDSDMAYMPGILHYFGVYPEGRHYSIPYFKISENEIEFRKSFIFQNKKYTIYYSKTCCTRYIEDGSRLWIVTGEKTAKKLKGNSPAVLKGYFDGSFLNFNKFPTDASMYLFLWDPKSPGERGIDIPIE
ncbi:MAG: glycosyltransferase family 39 protein [Syntrophaceae bacterium]|nr:glycosyltransferase family 39 protein [Syntrophaceae bacterium]